METTPNRVTVAIAGASGFVGTHLSAALRDEYRVVALTRRAQETPGIEGRACDLFSASSTVAALRGVDVAPLQRLLGTSLSLNANFVESTAPAGPLIPTLAVLAGGLSTPPHGLSAPQARRPQAPRGRGNGSKALGIP
jgi:uncharacterized protein YbjT (DUF2867 family)